MPWYCFIVRCSDGSLYVGMTADLWRRVKEHNAGRGGRYTRTRLPVMLVYAERYYSRRSALRREYEVKQLTRAKKESLITEQSFLPPDNHGVWRRKGVPESIAVPTYEPTAEGWRAGK